MSLANRAVSPHCRSRARASLACVGATRTPPNTTGYRPYEHKSLHTFTGSGVASPGRRCLLHRFCVFLHTSFARGVPFQHTENFTLLFHYDSFTTAAKLHLIFIYADIVLQRFFMFLLAITVNSEFEIKNSLPYSLSFSLSRAVRLQFLHS